MLNYRNEELTIIIPVRNEEDNIIKNLLSIKNQVKIPHNIIVVDGCSTDETFNLVSNHSRKHKKVKIIKTTPEQSNFKNSIKVGIEASKTNIIVVMMGDLCDDPKTINSMYEKIQQGFDIVVASRYMKGGSRIGEPKLQGSLSRLVSKTLHLLTGIPIYDVSNPFRIYRKNVLSQIDITHEGNEVSIEELFKAHIKGFKITEVATTWKGRKSGKSKFKLLKVVPGYTKLYLWILFHHKQPTLWRFIYDSIIIHNKLVYFWIKLIK